MAVISAMAICLAVTMEARADSNCVRSSELGTLDVRLMQTELMVAALTCQRKPDYNRFVRQFETELVARGKALKALFRRMHGSKADSRLNRFVTRLANEASLRSIQKTGYCASAARLFQATLQVPPGDLTAFAAAQPFSHAHGLPVCGPDSQISDARPLNSPEKTAQK